MKGLLVVWFFTNLAPSWQVVKVYIPVMTKSPIQSDCHGTQRMPLNTDLLTRRESGLACLIGMASLSAGASRLWADENSRELKFIVKDEFGTGQVADITALIKSVADEIWQYCLQTKFLGRGFSIYRHRDFPIVHFKQEDGLVIGWTNVCAKLLRCSNYGP